MAIKKFKKNNKILDYKVLFKTLSPKDFLKSIFFSINFTKQNCTKHKIDFTYRMQKVNQVFNYFHEDDLYKYFKINHEFHKDKSKLEYVNSLYLLMSDLISQIPSVEFYPLENNLIAKPIYLHQAKYIPQLLNILRDFLDYYDTEDIMKKESLLFFEYKAFLKEIYQKELLPIDISQQSYF
jgi:hypothetical protein